MFGRAKNLRYIFNVLCINFCCGQIQETRPIHTVCKANVNIFCISDCLFIDWPVYLFTNALQLTFQQSGFLNCQIRNSSGERYIMQ